MAPFVTIQQYIFYIASLISYDYYYSNTFSSASQEKMACDEFGVSPASVSVFVNNF